MSDPLGWLITIERNDGKVLTFEQCPNDELEYAVDKALIQARADEGTFDVPK